MKVSKCFVFPLIFTGCLITGCESDTSNDVNHNALHEEMVSAIASGDESEIRHVLGRVDEQSEEFDEDPDTHKYRAKGLIHLGKYQDALDTLSTEHKAQSQPENLLLQCMLTEHVKGDAEACYLSVVEHYQQNHTPPDAIHPDWVLAAMMSDHPSTQKVTQSYLDQERKKGSLEERMAKQLIENVENSTYVQDVLGTD